MASEAVNIIVERNINVAEYITSICKTISPLIYFDTPEYIKFIKNSAIKTIKDKHITMLDLQNLKGLNNAFISSIDLDLRIKNKASTRIIQIIDNYIFSNSFKANPKNDINKYIVRRDLAYNRITLAQHNVDVITLILYAFRPK